MINIALARVYVQVLSLMLNYTYRQALMRGGYSANPHGTVYHNPVTNLTVLYIS